MTDMHSSVKSDEYESPFLGPMGGVARLDTAEDVDPNDMLQDSTHHKKK